MRSGAVRRVRGRRGALGCRCGGRARRGALIRCVPEWTAGVMRVAWIAVCVVLANCGDRPTDASERTSSVSLSPSRRMLAFRQRVERRREGSLYLVNRTKLTPDASRALEWAGRKVGRPIRFDRYTLPQVMAAALRSMYLNASNHERDAGVVLYRDPTLFDSTWAHCDTTVDAYMDLLGRFDIATRRLTLWHAEDETHAAL